jgi:hypothetical protein
MGLDFRLGKRQQIFEADRQDDAVDRLPRTVLA